MTKTSIGVQELRKRIWNKAKTDPHHRFWGLYTHVWKLDTLGEAYRLAKQNHGAPQRPKRRGGRCWTTWSTPEIYGSWKLYNDYRVAWCSVPSG